MFKAFCGLGDKRPGLSIICIGNTGTRGVAKNVNCSMGKNKYEFVEHCSAKPCDWPGLQGER